MGDDGARRGSVAGTMDGDGIVKERRPAGDNTRGRRKSEHRSTAEDGEDGGLLLLPAPPAAGVGWTLLDQSPRE